MNGYLSFLINVEYNHWRFFFSRVLGRGLRLGTQTSHNGERDEEEKVVAMSCAAGGLYEGRGRFCPGPVSLSSKLCYSWFVCQEVKQKDGRMDSCGFVLGCGGLSLRRGALGSSSVCGRSSLPRKNVSSRVMVPRMKVADISADSFQVEVVDSVRFVPDLGREVERERKECCVRGDIRRERTYLCLFCSLFVVPLRL